MWEAHQSMGFFGWTPSPKPEGTPTARWKGVVDLEAAYVWVADVFAVWRVVCGHPESPPFAGGVWDDWPARLAEGVATCRAEWATVLDVIRREG